MFLIVGLGNPGTEYEGTRHNAGFMVAKHLLLTRDLGKTRHRYKGRWCEGKVKGRPVALLLPQTYMNLAGKSVASAANKKHIPAEKIIVIHDDMDFPFGTVRARSGGGVGGHNGLESIVNSLGTNEFNRVRVGVGRPEDPFVDQRDWVLSQLDVGEAELLQVLDTAADCTETIVTRGIEAAMNTYNQKDKEET